MRIRSETEADLVAIGEVNRVAFGGEREARLVDELRAAGYARLSVVAAEDGRIVGHVMLSEAGIQTENGPIEALALGPVGMLPDRQGEGIGSALIREALSRWARAGHRIVVLVGHPGYYPRFGFSAGLAENPSFAYSGKAFMALELAPGVLSGASGRLRFAPPFERVS